MGGPTAEVAATRTRSLAPRGPSNFRRRKQYVGASSDAEQGGRSVKRATVFPYSYPRTTPIPSLNDHLTDRMKRLHSAVSALTEADLADPTAGEVVAARLMGQFRCDEIVLGKATLDGTTGTEQVLLTDPRRLGFSQTPRRIAVDVHTVKIPVSGNLALLDYWPPDAHAAEPSERVYLDGVEECVRIPALVDPNDPNDGSARHFLKDQEALIRKLAEASNNRVAQWNSELAAEIKKALGRQTQAQVRRRETKQGLGYDLAERPARRPKRPQSASSGPATPDASETNPIRKSARPMSEARPKALVSWAHIDLGWTKEQIQERQDAVLAFTNALREHGIDADVDLFHHNKTTDWTRFGPSLIAEPDRIVLGIVSKAWQTAWEGGGDPTKGAGAAAEADALRSTYAMNRDTFLVRLRLIILPGASNDEVPNGLHGVPRYSITSYDKDGMADLLRDLLDNPRFPPSPLGSMPSFDPEPPPGTGQSAPAKPDEALHSWEDLGDSVDVTWRQDTSAFNNEEAALTIHVVELDGRRVSARQMPELEGRARAYLRSSGLVADDLPIRAVPDQQGVTIAVDAPHPAHGTVTRGQAMGVRLHYDGQVAVWKTLPRDSMGYVVDPTALKFDVAECLKLVASVLDAGPHTVALAAEIGPTTLITEGTVESLGRSRATMLKTGKGSLRVPPDEAIAVQDLGGAADDIANDYAPVLRRAWEHF